MLPVPLLARPKEVDVAYVLFIHGLDNKPEQKYLHDLWLRKLAFSDGVDLITNGVTSAMAYWANVLYEAPDANLAAYEAVDSGLETLGAGDVLEAPGPLDLEGVSETQAASIRRLAARLGVDPGVADDTLPPPEELTLVRLERLPVPDWLRRRIMGRFVRDAHHYFYNESFSPRLNETYRVRDVLRSRFIDGLRAAASQGPVVVVSHSMGTVIAYDCLMHEPDCPAIDGLITIGSPLGLDEVQTFFPGYMRANAFPAAKLNGPWVNVFDPLDVVAGLDPLLANDYQSGGRAQIEDLREDNWGTWRHSISKYLQGKQLRTRLAQMLQVTWP